MILSVFYGIGSIAALLGGGIADCFGHRKWYVLVFVSSYLQSLFLLIQVIS